MPHAKPDIEKKICETALQLAAIYGWNALTLDQIAKAARLPANRVHAAFSDKNRILPTIIGWIDQRMGAAIGKIDSSDPPRDRLFEVMMARFDILQKHRAAILAIVNDSRRDPRLVRLMLPAQIRSMRQIISLARLNFEKIQETVVIFGLLAVHYHTLWQWRKDTTRDMAKTMATLDKSLRCAGRAAEMLFRDSK